MKLIPNAFYFYVTDAPRSTEFYKKLFDIEPVFTSPFYVAFEIEGGVTFALWAGASEALADNPPRTSELAMHTSLSPDEIDEIYTRWVELGATSVQAPFDAPFGRTFVVADPDNNLIRVAPVD